MSAKYLEVGIKSEAASRRRPLTGLDVLSGITQKVEVGEKSVFDDVIPFKSSARGSEGFGGGVVEIKGRADGGRPFLEGFSYVLAKCIP